jgi:aconitate hydratase
LQSAVTCRLDTSAEVEVYKAGGILQKFAKDVIAENK